MRQILFCLGRQKTYTPGLLLRDEMARVLNEDVRPIALLVHDPCLRPGVIEPGRGRAAREALDAAKRRVLKDGKKIVWFI